MSKPPADLPYMRLWVKVLLGDPDASDMTDEEFGIYMRLLLVAWKRGGIPEDMEQRARSVKASPKKLAKLWPALAEKWESNGEGLLVNPRQERERAEATKLAAKRSAAASKAAQTRWGSDAERMPDASATHAERNASQVPVQRTENREEEEKPFSSDEFFGHKAAADRAELEQKERDGTINDLEAYSLAGYRDEERLSL